VIASLLLRLRKIYDDDPSEDKAQLLPGAYVAAEAAATYKGQSRLARHSERSEESLLDFRSAGKDDRDGIFVDAIPVFLRAQKTGKI
jgi:hypothetical protein